VTDDLVQHVENWFVSDIDSVSLNFHWNSLKFLKQFCMKLSQKTWLPQVLCQMGAHLPGGNFFDVGIQKLVSRYDKCLNSEDDYAEK
jgi:hypothetical protein